MHLKKKLSCKFKFKLYLIIDINVMSRYLWVVSTHDVSICILCTLKYSHVQSDVFINNHFKNYTYVYIRHYISYFKITLNSYITTFRVIFSFYLTRVFLRGSILPPFQYASKLVQRFMRENVTDITDIYNK